MVYMYIACADIDIDIDIDLYHIYAKIYRGELAVDLRYKYTV